MHSTTKGVETNMRKALASASHSLSDRQLLFVTGFLEGKSKSEAALDAGYESASAAAVFRSAKVQAALSLVLDRFLVGELAPMAMRTAYRLMNDVLTPAGVKASLALGVLDRAGFTAKRHEANQAASSKDPSAMSREELGAEIERLSREIDGRMKDITPDGAPVSEPMTSQELDMYE